MQQRTLLFLTVVVLLSVGIVMIYSTSAFFAQEAFNDGYFFLKRQAVWIAIGLAGFALAVNTDYHSLREHSLTLLFASFALLLLVHVPGIGKEAGGASRWLRVGLFSFQPSELAKFALVLYLADAMARKQRQIGRFWKGLAAPLLLSLAVLVLVIVQPDLGTTILIAMVAATMFFAAGVRLRLLLALVLAALPAVYALVFSSPYRKRRIIAFINPWADPEGTGFQIIQSFIALGSGGIGGMGLAQSRQKFYYLPAAHTDFIFSIIGEELGFVGTGIVVTLFLILLVTGMNICRKAPDFYGHLLALGIVSLLTLQTLINVGVVTGSLPTKGLPLPFISFGGSSMVLNLFAVGVLMNIGKHMGEDPALHYLERHSGRTVRI